MEQSIAARLAGEASPVPQEVTPRQFKLALLQTGISPSTITNALAGNEAALIEWEASTVFRRDHPLINAMAPAFGFNSQQLDNLFILAATQ